MTKQWDQYEATIKDLYAENTLSVVRQMMIDQYGFKASVRAYRGRLIRWGVRKYNCRKRSSAGMGVGNGGMVVGGSRRCASPSASSGSFSSGSDPASPAIGNATTGLRGGGGGDMMRATLAPRGGGDGGRRLGGGGDGGYLAMPGRMGHQQHQQQYGAVDGHQAHLYNGDCAYDTKPKVLLSPPLATQQSSNNNSLQYAWDATASPLHPPSMHKRLSDDDNNGYATPGGSAQPHHTHKHHQQHHGEVVMAPPTYFGTYGAATSSIGGNSYAPPQSNGYEEAGHRGSNGGLIYYDSSQRARDGGGGQMSADLSYAPAVRDYGHMDIKGE
ncbi:uncharacterized protein F4822DRAFT_297200 [Hypoxylon trugodes]|uniref:uncharacterized protein n=1 Tax=Hypoxylon trugodes TaxID=326681 RepID=UPI00219C9909|nr:uncharacterized protein F4822DRAFT_297200 [Hypoxylon trugodes]KAI1387960.1 hypothetical protein F4822DRAFT_297200 [Hypoxylon trugodes]